MPFDWLKGALVPLMETLSFPSRGVSDFCDGSRLLANADKIADGFAIGKPIVDHLYLNSDWNHLPREEWVRRIQVACSTDLIILKSFRSFPLGELEYLINEKAKSEAFEKLDSSRATLFLTFHGGYGIMARKVFATTYEDGLIFRRRGQIIGKAGATNDLRDALFVLLRGLQEGKNVFFAADGRDGRQSVILNVLGTATLVGEGAAFLAFASGCNTAWYTVGRVGAQFVPIVEIAPARQSGEKFDEFKARFYCFYAAKIEAMFKGDPRNIVLRPRWSLVFSAKARGVPIPFSSPKNPDRQ